MYQYHTVNKKNDFLIKQPRSISLRASIFAKIKSPMVVEIP